MPSKSKTLYNGNGYGYTLTASFSQGTQNTTNNTTSITVTATLKSTGSSFAQSNGCSLAIYWYDNNANSSGKKVNSKGVSALGSGSSTSTSGTITVTHKADGTLSGYAKAVWTRGDNVAHTPASGNVSTSNTALTTIPRKSTPSMGASSYTVTTTSLPTLVVNTNRASSSFTHTASININGTSYTMATKSTAASISWAMTAAARTKLLAAIPNATQYTATVTLTTYSGDTSLGSATCTTVLKINNSYKPTIGTPATTEQNTTVTNISGFTNGTIVANLSSAQVGVTASSNGSSTISSVKIQNGTVIKTATLTSGTYYATFAANELKSATFTATATDSRGYTNTSTYTGTYVSYINPSITQVDVHRLTSTSSTTSISVSGNWYNGSIGNVQNAITVKYQYARIYDPQKDYISTAGADYDDQYVFYDDKVYKCTTSTPSPAGAWDSTKWQEYTEYTTLTPTTNGNTYTAANLSGLTCEYQYNYKVKVQVNDAINGVVYTSIVGLNSAVPVLWMGRDTVRVNQNFIIDGSNPTISMNQNSGGTDSLSSIDFETWTKLASRGVWKDGTLATTSGTDTELPDLNGVYLIETHSYSNGLLNSVWVVRPSHNIGFRVGEGFRQQSNSGVVFASGYAQYQNSTYTLTRHNGIVTVLVYAKPTSDVSWGDGQKLICTLPSVFAPAQEYVGIMQGSSKNVWRMVINPNGQVTGARYGTTANTTTSNGAWLNICATYVAGGGSGSSPIMLSINGTTITVKTYTSNAYVHYMKVSDIGS